MICSVGNVPCGSPAPLVIGGQCSPEFLTEWDSCFCELSAYILCNYVLKERMYKGCVLIEIMDLRYKLQILLQILFYKVYY